MEVYMLLSMSDFFKCPVTLNRLQNCGLFSSYLDPFAQWMAKQQFADVTIRNHISNVAHFSHSLNGIKPGIEDLNELIQSFLFKHIPSCKCKGWKQRWQTRRISNSLNRFKGYLSDCHRIDFISDNPAYSQIHNEFLFWLSDDRRLQNSTIKLRSSYLKQFLQWYQETSNYQNLQALKADDVESFFIKATRRWATAYKRSLQATLRSFFDFCHQRGYILQNLRFSLPVIKTYRLSEVPKKIDDNEAIRLLESIDRSTDSGKRTYAIVQILYTYGVRGCQLRALKLSDIDWHQEQIHFPAVKGGKSCAFPLTAEVGNALVDYLKNARQKCRHQQVFLTLRAPFSPLKKSRTLSQIIRSAMLKAAIKSPRKGTHCFRHGFVSRMLKQGESFKHIADLLGHKHIATTFIYTKIDFNALGQVALELPEVQYENG
jgi:site-specific recombinase XerD